MGVASPGTFGSLRRSGSISRALKPVLAITYRYFPVLVLFVPLLAYLRTLSDSPVAFPAQ